MKGYGFFLRRLVMCCGGVRAEEPDRRWKNDLYGRIAPAPAGAGFEDEAYWVWGSSVMKGDDGAYLFFATIDGPGGFGNSTKLWNMVVPLKTEERNSNV